MRSAADVLTRLLEATPEQQRIYTIRAVALAGMDITDAAHVDAALIAAAFDSFSKDFPAGCSQSIKRHFKVQGKLFTDPQRLLEVEGALVGWTNDDAWTGGIRLVLNRKVTRSDRGNVVTGIESIGLGIKGLE